MPIPFELVSETLAKEVTVQLFDRLPHNQVKEENDWYQDWLDSNQYLFELEKKAKAFTLPTDIDIWAVDADHCFPQIDRLQLAELSRHLNDAAFKDEHLPFIKKRLAQRKANPLVPDWWHAVSDLMLFDGKGMALLNSLEETVNYYTRTYYPLDYAIRLLYENFLEDTALLKPIQEYYESIDQELLEKWWKHKKQYYTNQQGFLGDWIQKVKKKTAIIVGDAVHWEIAIRVATGLDVDFKIEKNVLLADLSSVTEHNMSAMYVGGNQVIKDKTVREKKLSELTGKEITYLDLEKVNATTDEPILVLTYKDVDTAGEHLQQDAIKFFLNLKK